MSWDAKFAAGIDLKPVTAGGLRCQNPPAILEPSAMPEPMVAWRPG